MEVTCATVGLSHDSIAGKCSAVAMSPSAQKANLCDSWTVAPLIASSCTASSEAAATVFQNPGGAVQLRTMWSRAVQLPEIEVLTHPTLG